MSKKYLPSEFSKIASFGEVKSAPNAAGVNIPKFVGLFKLHYRPVKRTQNQTYLAKQSGLDDTFNICIRHNEKVHSKMQVKIKNVNYDIVTISPDDAEGFGKYDFITLRAKKKVGGA